jgi:phage shock protein PspC (stress-responsive transcriptional regulator)
MKKTIVINLAGIPFEIEEDAYEMLKSYLEKIESRLGNTNEAKEVTADIESRIAELFRQEKYDINTPITSSRISEIISIIGQPEQFETASDTKNQSSENTSSPGWTGKGENEPKRLLRSRYRRIFGGVCGGLADYFGIDVVLVRIIFILLFLLPYGKFVALGYIVMWIVIPRATILEQMMMSKTSKDYGSKVAGRRTTTMPSSQSPAVRIFSTVAGVILLVTGIMGLVVLSITTAVAIGGFNSGIMGVVPSEIVSLVTLSKPGILFWWSVILVLVLPLLFLIYAGLRLLINFKAYLGAVFAASFMLWIFANAFIVYSAVDVAKDFSTDSQKSEFVQLTAPSDETFVISPDDDNTDSTHVYKFTLDKYSLYTDGSKRLLMKGKPKINIEYGDSLKCRVVTSARGRNMADAVKNRQQIKYRISQTDSVIHCGKLFEMGNEIPFRLQKVEIFITIPKNMKVNVDPGLSHLVDF